MDRSLFIFNFEPQKEYHLATKYIFVFIILFFSSFFILEVINKKCFVEKKAHIFRLYNNFLSKKDSSEVLLIGDSHIGDDILADELPYKTANFGIPGTGYAEFYYFLKYYIHQMPKLKVLVLEIDYNNFSSYRSNSFTKFPFWNRFFDYKELERIKGKSIRNNQFKNFTLLDEQLGRGFFIENLYSLIAGEKNWDELKKTWGYPKEPSPKERAISHYKDRDLYNEDILFYYESILKLCDENNVKVFTIQLPISTEYSTEAREITKIDHFKNYINKRFSKYVSFHSDYEFFYKEKQNLFKSNGDHLNPEGSIFFTKVFSKDLERVIKQ